MKKIIALAALTLLVGCSSSGNKQCHQNINATQNECAAREDSVGKAVKSRLEAIYTDVFGWYTEAESNNDIEGQKPNFDDKYMSDGYRSLIHKVEKHDEAILAQGEIGFFDSDHWVCGQDYGNLSMKVRSGKLTGKDRYEARVDIHNLGNVEKITIILVYEHGQWMIDDLLVSGQSERKSMTEYLKN